MIGTGCVDSYREVERADAGQDSYKAAHDWLSVRFAIVADGTLSLAASSSPPGLKQQCYAVSPRLRKYLLLTISLVTQAYS
jgi:hypothetical protein